MTEHQALPISKARVSIRPGETEMTQSLDAKAVEI